MKASLVEVTLLSTSLVVSTIPRTKEWKLQRRFNTDEDRGKDGFKATPKGPPTTAQREQEEQTKKETI